MKKESVCAVRFLSVLGVILISTIAAGEQRYFDSNGVKLHYTDDGRGTPVLLIHGYAENARKAWRDTGIAKELIAAGFRVVAYDHRGHGQSEKPQAAEEYGMEMVRDAVRVLNYLKIKQAHVVGYSMGAVIANKLREQHPELLLSVTLAGYGEPPTPERFTRELEEQVETNLRRMGLLEGNDARALSVLTTRWSEWSVDAKGLGENQVPALALVGADDPFLADTRRLAERMPALRVVVVAGDHGTARHRPEFVKELLTFLQTPAAK